MFYLNGFLGLRFVFPELTEHQFKVLVMYAFGYNINTVSDILGCSPNAIKMVLRKIKEKLDIDRMESAIIIYHSRVFSVLAISIQYIQTKT